MIFYQPCTGMAYLNPMCIQGELIYTSLSFYFFLHCLVPKAMFWLLENNPIKSSTLSLPLYWEFTSFNDRIRDAILGGSPFGHPLQQGFATGLLLQVYNDFLGNFYKLLINDSMYLSSKFV